MLFIKDLFIFADLIKNKTPFSGKKNMIVALWVSRYLIDISKIRE